MERLNKRQKEILTYLNKAYPFSISKEYILHEFVEPEEVFVFNESADIKLLEDMKLITPTYGKLGDAHLIITPKGKEKLRENFMTRLTDAVYDNPLKAVSVGIALILGILGLIITLWK